MRDRDPIQRIVVAPLELGVGPNRLEFPPVLRALVSKSYCLPRLEINPERRLLHRLQCVHVERHRVADDLLEEFLGRLDLALL